MKSAIVTGATGVIGTALIKTLIGRGVEVLVLARPDSLRNERIPKSPLVNVIGCPLNALKGLENESKKSYDVFYHLAWNGTFGAERNDARIQEENILFALDAVEAAKRFGCRTFLGAGSQAEYGRVNGVLTADTPVNPETCYGIAKLCAGRLTKAHATQLGMRHIWVRILSVYGENDGENTMVTSAVTKLKRGERARFTRGEQLWDYLYSGDAAEALYLLGERGQEKTYVLGSGSAKPLSEYISEIASLFHATELVELGAIPYPEGQVMHLEADITPLTKDTGWLPRTPFSKGIRNIIKSL